MVLVVRGHELMTAQFQAVLLENVEEEPEAWPARIGDPGVCVRLEVRCQERSQGRYTGLLVEHVRSEDEIKPWE
ncbi:MAG TPA: hypothetical protein VGK54_05200, partial [Chloroflexota bacterium]